MSSMSLLFPSCIEDPIVGVVYGLRTLTGRMYRTGCFDGQSGDELADLIGELFAPTSVVDSGSSYTDLKERVLEDSAQSKVGHLGLRFRRRGRVTASFQAVAKALPGWWEDESRDLTGDGGACLGLRWFESYLKDSKIKVGGMRQLEVVDGDGESSPITLVQAHFSSDEGGRWLWVCPELLAQLVTVRLFRPMSEGLLASLRSKARLWARDAGVSVERLVAFLPGTLVLAMVPMPDEIVAVGSLRGHAGQWSVDVLGKLSKGVLSPPSLKLTSWWDVLRPSLRFGGKPGSTIGGAGCARLTLPT